MQFRPLVLHLQTTKFWVHRDNIAYVKSVIQQHLPEYVFSRDVSSLVQSVYFGERTFSFARSPIVGDLCCTFLTRMHSPADNDKLDLYNDRLLLAENGRLFRYRWYGNGEPKGAFASAQCYGSAGCFSVGFMENKTRKYGWLGETSNKRRFLIPINKVVRQAARARVLHSLTVSRAVCSYMNGLWKLNKETDKKATPESIELAAEMQKHFVSVRSSASSIF